MQDNLQKKLTTLQQSSSRMVILQILSAMLLPHPHSSGDEGQEEEKGSLVVMPYVAGMSENIRHACRKFNIRVVFTSGWTLCSMLTKVKDTLPSPTAPVLYHIPALWSPPRGSGGGYPMHASLQLTSPSSLSRRHLSIPSVLSPCWTAFQEKALHNQMTPSEECCNRDRSSWLLDHCDEEAGRKEQSSPTFDLQCCVSSEVHDYESSCILTLLHFRLDDDWSIQLKHQKFIFRAQVGNR